MRRVPSATATDDPPVESRPSRARRLLPRLVLLAAVVSAVAVVLSSGLAGQVSDQRQLQATVTDAGTFGPVLFVVLMTVLVPLNVPGVLFAIPATTLFGTVPGVLLSLVGGFLGSAIGVVTVRHLGRSAIETRLPARVQRFEAKLSERGFWTVVALRMLTYLAQPVDWLCGLSAIPLRTVLVATFVGLIPPTLVITLAGGSVLDLLL